MYGVVLWSDSRQTKAVIWCEDHRNLAFFKRDGEAGPGMPGGGTRFVPGDLVEFDLREENDLRLAVDPCLVAPHEYPSLAADLRSACAGLERAPVGMPRAEPRSEPAQRTGRVVVLHPQPATAQRRLAACQAG